MNSVSAGQKALLGLGRYRFQERLSTCFFGPRFRVTCDGDSPSASQRSTTGRNLRPGYSGSPGQSLHPAQSLYPSIRPSVDTPLAMRLVCAETQPEIERLARAVQSVRDLDHRAVLKPLQMVRSSTRLGVITHHVDGVTLGHLLASSDADAAPVPPAVTLRIIVDVIEGLEALRAHASAMRRQDWLFGGLTPDSILVGSDGQSRLLDPGLTGAAARQPAFSQTPAALAYSAPELTSPDASFDPACDVFSLGVMLWELLAGQPLFAAATAAQTLENLHRAPIARVQRQHFVRGEPLAFALAQAVANALKRNVAQRTQDYDALLTGLMQAGPIGQPEAVADWVRQSMHKEPGDAIQARITRLQALEAAAAPATAPRITLPSPASPRAEPPATLEAPDTSNAPTLPPSAVPPSASEHASRMSSAAPTARIRRLPGTPASPPNEPGQATHPPPAVLRLGHELADQVSAFPIGDLKRASYRRSGIVPAALAAALLLGLGVLSLRFFGSRDERAEAPHAAASGRAPAPTPAPRQAPAAAQVPDQPVVDTHPDLPAKTAPAEHATRAQPPASAPSEAKPAPKLDSKPRPDNGAKPKPETKPALVIRPAPAAEPKREPQGKEHAPAQQTPRFSDLPPPEPEPAPHGGVLKITPAPEPSGKYIPEDI